MKRTYPNSRLEIWDALCINDVNRRPIRDKNLDIIQIERGVTGRDYIVEVVEKAEQEKTPSIEKLARQIVDKGKEEGFVI